MLDLRVSEYVSDTEWRWQLTDAAGTLLAHHDVSLDPACAEYALLTDPYQNLWRLDVHPAYRARSERNLLRKLGAYVAAEVLGSAGEFVLSCAPVTVRVIVPALSAGLLSLPLELAHWGGEPLALCGVGFCYDPAEELASPAASGPEDRSADRLRMLAVFALPQTSSALGLVRERRSLVRSACDEPIAAGMRPVDLHVLQYGATKERVRQAMADPRGWDVIHLSGHGGPGRFYLETESGDSAPVDAEELLGWLEPCQRRTTLVVLSACESGIARAARVLGLPGLVGARSRGPRPEPSALGYAIARQLGCAVLATRYPVYDRFSVAFERLWYHAVLVEGCPVDRAIPTVLARALLGGRNAPLSVATPMLLGPTAIGLGLQLPRRQDGRTRPAGPVRARMSSVPSESDSFIGRTTLLARVSAVLTADPGVVVLGMPGVGKSSASIEAAHRQADAYEAIGWHRASRRDTMTTLTRVLRGLLPHHRTAGRQAPHRRQSGATDIGDLVEQLRHRHLLIVVDDAQALLNGTGGWRSGEIGDLLTALLKPGGRTRLVLISDRPLPGLGHLIGTVTVPLLSRSESDWLAREVQERELASGTPVDIESAPGLPWHVCRGHPGLIEYCSAGTPELVRRRTRRLDRAWQVSCPAAPSTLGAVPAVGRDNPGSLVKAWAVERASELTDASRRALAFLSSLEGADRVGQLAELAWSMVNETAGLALAPLEQAARELVDTGLAERPAAESWLLHPAVTSAGRALDARLSNDTAVVMQFIWKKQYERARDIDAGRQALAACTAHGVPYLIRLGRLEEASAACERALSDDESLAGQLLAFSTEIVRASAGTPFAGATRFVRAKLVLAIDVPHGRQELEQLLHEAVEAGDDVLVLASASALVTAVSSSDPLGAHKLLQAAQAAASAQNLQAPWVTLLLLNLDAEILAELGDTAGALSQAQAVLDGIDRLSAEQVEPRGVDALTLRASALGKAFQAARQMGDQAADAYQAQLRLLDQTAAERALARAQLADVAQLIRAGQLLEAREYLLAALRVFDDPGDIRQRGLIFIDLAQVEHKLGQSDFAIDLGRRALRASYSAGERNDAAAAHGRMANFLAAVPGSVRAEAPAHLLAAAVIRMRVLSGLQALTANLEAPAEIVRLAFCAARQPGLIPQSFAALEQILSSSTDIDLDALLRGLRRAPVSPDGTSVIFAPNEDPPGDSVTDAIRWMKRKLPPEHLVAVSRYPHYWQPAIDAVIGAPSAQEISDLLENLRSTGWADLADAFTELVDTGSAYTIPAGLRSPDRDVVALAIAGLRRPGS
jgi:tetratricopeptide (TPR) repeat protein